MTTTEARYVLLTQCLQNDLFASRECRLALPGAVVRMMLLGKKQQFDFEQGEKGRRRLPPDVLAAIEQTLRQPAGVASYEALRQWVRQTHHLDVNYHTLYTIVRTKLKAKLKVPRPSHTKKPGRHPGISGDLSGAAATRHPAGEYPPGARLQSG